jgi:hypothetical protein
MFAASFHNAGSQRSVVKLAPITEPPVGPAAEFFRPAT